MIVDSHCHLNFPDFKDDIDAVIERAEQNGVGLMQTICTEMAEFEEIHEITRKYPSVYCSVGVHPNDSAKADIAEVEHIVNKAKLDKVIGIGETGLDYYYETAPREIQKKSFLNHLEASRISGLPVIIHTRDAEDDTISILKAEMEKGKFCAVLHCFTGSMQLAKAALDLGLYISFAGVVTFKNAQSLREIGQYVPEDRMLVETDAPFLAPVPMRGKRNEPAYTRHTAEFMAELRGISPQKLAEQTTKNFFELFNKAA
jgi:TatD DNase family protein